MATIEDFAAVVKAKIDAKGDAGPTAVSMPSRVGGLEALRLTGDRVQTTWVTPDGTGVIVHPCVRYFPDGQWGYLWWAVATPYFNSDNQVENPCLYVSDDGINFVPAPGVTNPLRPAPPGGYNSDTHLVVGPDGRMHIFYRAFSAPEETIRVFSSSDGVTWSGDTVIISRPSTVKRLMCPTVWFDPAADEWVMLAVDILPAPNVLERWTAKAPEGPWVHDAPVSILPVLPEASGIWHMDAIRMGQQIVMLFNSTPADGWAGPSYLAISSDGARSFVRGPALSRTGDYRSTLQPVLTERGLEFDVWIGKGAPLWGAYRQALRAPGVDEDTRVALEMYQAERGLRGGITYDWFDRADAAVLGSTPTGVAWEVSAGGFGVVSGRAKASAVANHRALLESGVADHEIAAEVTVNAGVGQAWLLVRVANSNNYYRAGLHGSDFMVQQIKDGAVTAMATVPNAGASERISVEAKGTTLTFRSAGMVLWSGEAPDNAGATKVGIQTNTNTTTFDNVIVRAA